MQNISSMLENKQIQALAQQAGSRVTNAVYQASKNTGVDFSYLMQQASAESSFDIDAKAKTSSASGLYQFIEKTWVSMVDRYGDKHGIGRLASQIDSNGKIADPKIRQEILDLRNDPKMASLMAGEFAAENKNVLEGRGVNNIGSTELYFSHFLGAGAASSFLLSHQDNPKQLGAEMLPAAAGANKRVFFHGDGKAKTLDEIYSFFDKKFKIEESKQLLTSNEPSKELSKTKTSYASSLSRSDIYSMINIDSYSSDLFTSYAGGGWESLAKMFMQNQSQNAHNLLFMLQEYK